MTSEAKPGRGLDPKIAGAIAYLGGLLTGIVMLMMEKHDRFVRFHAMQSVLTFLAVLVASLFLTGLPVLGRVLYIPFVIGIAALWIFLMVQAFLGHTYKLPYIGDVADHQLR